MYFAVRTAQSLGELPGQENLQNHPRVVPATVYVEASTLKDGSADSSPKDQSPELKKKRNDLLHIAFARVFSLLVTQVGTELAPLKPRHPQGV